MHTLAKFKGRAKKMCLMHKLKDEIPSFPLTFDNVGFNSRLGLCFCGNVGPRLIEFKKSGI